MECEECEECEECVECVECEECEGVVRSYLSTVLPPPPRTCTVNTPSERAANQMIGTLIYSLLFP